MPSDKSRKSNIYEFIYSGDFEAVNAVSVLQSQLNFIAIVNEIKNQISPDSKLDIKLQGLKKGSLEVHQLVELVTPAALFVKDNYETIKTIFKIFGDIFKLKTLLGDKKADGVIGIDNSVNVYINVDGKNNNVLVSPEAWKLYTENPRINDNVIKAGRTLDDSQEIKAIEVKHIKDKRPVAKLKSSDFKKIKEENPYSNSTFQYEYDYKQIIGIKKANLLPEAGRVLKWDVLYRNQTVPLKISDPGFIDQIVAGLRFGNGDKLLVDLKKSMRLDKTFNMFVETGQYEATKVYKVIPREEQSKLPLA